MMDSKMEYIVYMLKNGTGSSDRNIAEAMGVTTGTPDWDCGRNVIDKILRQACAEVIEKADNPVQEVRRYFMNDICIHNDYERMIVFLTETKVRDDKGNFINNFGAAYWDD